MCNRKTKSPASVVFLIASCLVWFGLAGEAHSVEHVLCNVEFTKEEAETLRQTPKYSSDPTCETEDNFSFDEPPSPEYFHVSNPTDTVGGWYYYESGEAVFERLANLIGALIKAEPTQFDKIKAGVDTLIDRISVDAYIQSLGNEKLSEILDEIYGIRGVTQKEVGGLISAQKRAEGAAEIFASLFARNRCKTDFLNNSPKGKRAFCTGEIAFTAMAGCQINYNGGKPVGRRGIVWIDDIPDQSNYVRGGRLRCWVPEDYQLLGRIFPKKERRYLCQRLRSEMKKPPVGDHCP